jgi:hypothetical protein
MSAKLFAIVALLTVFGLVMVNVRASIDDVDTYFENVRGQLLGFYGSELVSHAAIILGLIVALPSIFPRAWKALNLRGTSLRAFLRYFTRALTVVLIGTLILYTFGRLFFWSAQATSLMVATRTNLGVNITDSNVSCA